MTDPLAASIIGIMSEFLNAAFVPELVVQYHHKSKATLHVINARAYNIELQVQQWTDGCLASSDFIRPLAKKFNIAYGDMVQFHFGQANDESQPWFMYNGETLNDWSNGTFVLRADPKKYLPLNYYDDIVGNPSVDKRHLRHLYLRQLVAMHLGPFKDLIIRERENRERENQPLCTSFILVHPVDKQTYKLNYLPSLRTIFDYSVDYKYIELIKN